MKPGESAAAAQHRTITEGVDALRHSSASRTLKLGQTKGLQKLIKPAAANDESIVGTIALADLISFIASKSTGDTLVARDGIAASSKAENEAERRMREVMASDAAHIFTVKSRWPAAVSP